MVIFIKNRLSYIWSKILLFNKASYTPPLPLGAKQI